MKPSKLEKIVSMEEFATLRETLEGTIVCTSGGFDPIHSGHTSCIYESAKLGDILVVLVNNDQFLIEKKEKHFSR